MKRISGALQRKSSSDRKMTRNLETGKAFEKYLGYIRYKTYDLESFNNRFDGVVLAYGDGQLINDYTDRMGYCICKHLGILNFVQK